MEWTDLVRGRVQWPALVNTVMKLKVTYKAENFVSGTPTLGSTKKTLLQRENYVNALF
jgi:hypothetical protein